LLKRSCARWNRNDNRDDGLRNNRLRSQSHRLGVSFSGCGLWAAGYEEGSGLFAAILISFREDTDQLLDLVGSVRGSTGRTQGSKPNRSAFAVAASLKKRASPDVRKGTATVALVTKIKM
jgi:hypothetical protein